MSDSFQQPEAMTTDNWREHLVMSEQHEVSIEEHEDSPDKLQIFLSQER